MINFNRASVLFASTFIALPAICFAEEEKPLKAEFEVGIIATTGNTKTESYKGKFKVNQNLESWHNEYMLEGLFKSDRIIDETSGERSDTTTAEKYFASAQANYKINKKHSALFVYGEYDRNRFSGFDYQYTAALGYSDRLFTHDNSHFAYSVGPGYTVDQPESPEDADKEDNFIVRLSLEYVYKFSDHAKFTQNVSSNYATDTDKNTKTKSVSAVTANLNSSLSLRMSYTLEHNSEVVDGREHADTETAATIVYSF